MNDRFTKTLIVVCLILLIALASYWIGYNTGINDRADIHQIAFKTAAEPYSNNYDTSTFNPGRTERFKKITTDRLLPTDEGTKALHAESTQDSKSATN